MSLGQSIYSQVSRCPSQEDRSRQGKCVSLEATLLHLLLQAVDRPRRATNTFLPLLWTWVKACEHRGVTSDREARKKGIARLFSYRQLAPTTIRNIHINMSMSREENEQTCSPTCLEQFMSICTCQVKCENRDSLESCASIKPVCFSVEFFFFVSNRVFYLHTAILFAEL